jgi:transmembrane sensor
MSNVHELRPGGEDEAMAQACDWLARLERGLKAAEEEQLRAWIDADSNHLRVFLEVAQLWDKMDSLSCLADLFPAQATQRREGLRGLTALAASLLIAVCLGLLYYAGMGTEDKGAPELASDARNVYETRVGEQSTVYLVDGSALTLNTNSRVSVEYTDRERRVILERGEVFVDVAHDPSKPLSVRAGDQLVTAIGTAFNVEITDRHQVEVIVTEGKVVVAVAPPPQASRNDTARPPTQAGAAHALGAGEGILVGQATDATELIESTEIDVKLSWRGGNLVFRGETLADALDEIERYTEVGFVIVDEHLKETRIAGLFKAGDVDGLLQTLADNFDIVARRENNKIIALSAKP